MLMKGKSLSVNSFRRYINSIHPRTQKAHFNTLLGLVIKGGAMAISFLLVPITIDYLSKEVYGTWLAISSIVTMLTFLDIGIGNGLRNRLTQAVSDDNLKLARIYVSTSYAIFGMLQILFIGIFSLLVGFIPWQQILKTSIDNEKIQDVIWITIIGIAIKLVFDIITYVLLALQESSKTGMIALISNLVVLICTYLLYKYSPSNIVYLACLTAIIPVAVTFICSFILYNNILKPFKPSIKMVNLKFSKDLLSLGYKFFFIQIAVLILFYTDNIIITRLFGSTEVTVYNIAYRYFNAASVIFSIMITPYWSAFSEASAKGDYAWIRLTYRYLQKMWVGITILIIGMIIVAKPVYSIWVGDRVAIPSSLNVVIGASVMLICWNNVTVSIINGLGKVKLQLYCSVFAALVNIPLCIYFAKELNLGSAGVMIATCISLLPSSVTGTIQASKLSRGCAHGVWAA